MRCPKVASGLADLKVESLPLPSFPCRKPVSTPPDQCLPFSSYPPTHLTEGLQLPSSKIIEWTVGSMEIFPVSPRFLRTSENAGQTPTRDTSSIE